MKFCTAVNCMDGRTQEPVVRYLKQRFKADYVDMITEAGPNKILAEKIEAPLIDAIFERIRISVEQHGSKNIAVVGHHDCAKNTAGEEEQRIHTRNAVEIIRESFPELEVIGLWVNSKWRVTDIGGGLTE